MRGRGMVVERIGDDDVEDDEGDEGKCDARATVAKQWSPHLSSRWDERDGQMGAGLQLEDRTHL